ncbi:MAG: M4 family metallopeptidase [Caldilineales bacterium]|nr:M4 family metallopeptidase [Caldilineales bacterium]
MKRPVFAVLVISLWLFVSLAVGSTSFADLPLPPDVGQLRADAGGIVEITWNPLVNTPGFVSGVIPLDLVGLSQGERPDPNTTAFGILDRYATIFGMVAPAQELRVEQTDVDEIGMTHITMQQIYQGVEVYNATVKVHLSADGQSVAAIGNQYVPGIQLSSVQPAVTADDALAMAHQALPGGKLLAAPVLVVYVRLMENPGATARLAWIIELRDDAIPSRNVYVIDAQTGDINDVLDRLYQGAVTEIAVPTARNRETYDANHGTSLPGTLRRRENDGPVGDRDVDNAHDFAGTTYNYFKNTHNRDSFDDAGAKIISTVHYSRNYANAFWNGAQMVYGDDFPVNDVVAHELTHAVTERTANLEYRWQSGALNESFSDIFGAMIDREDWLMGEDLPDDALGGREAIRDLSDPKRFGQPDHVRDWVETSSDNCGVHTNSGIPNKAFFNIATHAAVGKDRAERIFFRALTRYLQANSSLEDARAQAIQSANDLYANDAAVANAVRSGFDAVGLDGQWQPPECPTCVAAVILDDIALHSDQSSALELATTLYRVRDHLNNSTAGRYYRNLYEKHTGRVSYLVLFDPSLRRQGGEILKELNAGFALWVNGNGSEVVFSQAMATHLESFLLNVAQADRASGKGEVAAVIRRETERVDLMHLVGMTFDQAWKQISTVATERRIYLPTILR